MRNSLIFFTFSVIIFSVNCLRIIYRGEWQQRSEPMSKREFESSSYVVLFQTGGASCHCPSECISRVRSIQHHSLETWGQMIYNYLIGADGSIYEGSGFYERAHFLRSLKRKCMLIGFIGNFTEEEPTPSAWGSLRKLINFGAQLRFINYDYALISSQQIKYDHQCEDRDEKFMFSTLKSHSQWKNITLTIQSKII